MANEQANPVSILDFVPAVHSNIQQEFKSMEEPPSLAEPAMYVDATAMPLNKGVTSSLIGHINSIMQTEAKRQSIPVLNTTLYGHTSPEDGSQKLVLTQVTGLAAKPALEYRRNLFKTVAGWMKTLPSEQMAQIQNNIVINISWNSDSIAT